MNYKASGMWEKILNDNIADLSEFSVEDFRSPGKLNSRLASWEPRELSLRWYRTFLNLAYRNSSNFVHQKFVEFKDVLNLGNPVTNEVTLADTTFRINLDYLLAFHELEFIQSQKIVNPQIVLEVGAGFGRLAHVLLTSYSCIEKYHIIDLPQILYIAKIYLQKVLPKELFNKVIFINSESAWKISEKIDLSIQVDGLQEMNTKVIDEYLKEFSKSRFFFSKNVIAKYLPKNAGLDESESEVPFHLGRSRAVVDIWNLSELEPLYETHQDSYLPENHKLLQSLPCLIFPHYLNFMSTRHDQ